MARGSRRRRQTGLQLQIWKLTIDSEWGARHGGVVARVVALILEAALRDRLLQALRGVAAVLFCETASGLLQLAGKPGVSVVLAQLRDRGQVSTLPAIAVLHRRFPSILTFVHGKLTTRDIHEMVAAVRDGWAEAIIDRVDDPGSIIRSAISQTWEQRSGPLIIESVRRFIPASLASFFSFRCNP
jgi:hypothetical protein